MFCCVKNIWAQFSLVDDWTMIYSIYYISLSLFFIIFAQMFLKSNRINRTSKIKFIPEVKLGNKNINFFPHLFSCDFSMNMEHLFWRDGIIMYFNQYHASIFYLSLLLNKRGNFENLLKEVIFYNNRKEKLKLFPTIKSRLLIRLTKINNIQILQRMWIWERWSKRVKKNNWVTLLISFPMALIYLSSFAYKT